MKKGKRIVIIVLLFALFSIAVYSQNAFACGCGGYSNVSPVSSHHSPPLPPMVPPMPEFERTWSANDLIKSLEGKGLKKQEHSSVLEGRYNDALINTAEEAVGFDLVSFGKEAGVSIHTFRSKKDLRKVQRYFLDLNEKGDLYTWSFVKDNIVLVLSGTIPEDIARQYERTLYSLK
jgi:hypothetical protein